MEILKEPDKHDISCKIIYSAYDREIAPMNFQQYGSLTRYTYQHIMLKQGMPALMRNCAIPYILMKNCK